jgi:flagellar basal-body rod modification protein FlgD
MSTTVQSTLASLPAVNSNTTPVAKNTLDENSFLKLLTTQLQQQDPLSPMDSNAFVAQLAQFAQVEGLNNISTKLDSLVQAQSNANQMNDVSMVGKQVTFKADQLSLTQGQTATFGLSLSAASTATTVTISDASGQVVRTLNAGSLPSGSSSLTWDGLDSNGQSLPSGTYFMSATGQAADGSAVTAASAVTGIVSGIDFSNAVPQLVVGGQLVALGNVTQISTPPAGS